jgi:hypothetical protein
MDQYFQAFAIASAWAILFRPLGLAEIAKEQRFSTSDSPERARHISPG